MERFYHLTDREKELLNVIGTYPDASMKELLNHTRYKWMRTVKKKLEQFKERDILFGPVYVINYGKLCKNPFHKLECTLETTETYETVTLYLKLIEPLLWIFPVLSSYRRLLHVAFLSSDDAETKALLQLLKDNNIITDYTVRVWRSRKMVVNPNLCGDPNPSLDGLLDPCELPDISLGHHDTVWDECDIAILPYLQTGFKDTNLIEILKEENNLHSRSWKYEKIKYSRDKMVKNKLIEKKYCITAFPPDQITTFHLFLKTDDITLTQRILHNFARGARLYKEYLLYEEWGSVYCACHPSFLTDLMHKLDQIDEITGKEFYQIRSIPSGQYCCSQPPELKYYDFDEQTLEYPYHAYKEKIKEKLESE